MILIENIRAFFHAPVAALYLVMWSAAFVLMAFEEIYSLVRKRHLFELKDTLANGAMYAGYFLLSALWVPVVYLLYKWCFDHRIASLGTGTWHVGQNGLWWEWVVLILLEDLCFYVFHRVSHHTRLLWASHVTHHSSDHFNLSTAFRQTWVPQTAVIFWLPLPLLGFDPLMVMTAQVFSLFYQLFLHTQLAPRLGPLEWILNTPSHHMIHHGANEPYVNKNFGGVFIIWDRLFGTFEKASVPIRYGIDPELHSRNPVVIAFHEWLAMGRDILKSRSPRDLWRAVAG